MIPTVVQLTTTPGTPVAVSATKLKCAMFWVVNFSTQIVSFGNRSLVRSSGVGKIADVPAYSSGTPDSSIIKMPPDAAAEDPYDLEDYRVDSATAAVVNIAYWTL